MTIFFNMNNYQNLSGKAEKYLYREGTAPPSCFGTGHVAVLFYTTLEDGVLWHTPEQVFQRT